MFQPSCSADSWLGVGRSGLGASDLSLSYFIMGLIYLYNYTDWQRWENKEW